MASRSPPISRDDSIRHCGWGPGNNYFEEISSKVHRYSVSTNTQLISIYTTNKYIHN